jgi:hypothetical protein
MSKNDKVKKSAAQEHLEQIQRDAQRSVDMLLASLREAAAYPREATVRFPFLTVDAALHLFLSGQKPMQYRRQGQSAGSAIYTLRYGSIVAGTIQIRAVLDGATHITTEINAGVDKMDEPLKLYMTSQLPSTLWAFVEWLHEDEHNMTELSKRTESFLIETSPVIVATPPELEDLAQQRPKTNEPPAKGAPFEDWLDWREAQISRRGRIHSLSYKRLSEMSGYSESFLKRKGAERSKQTTSEQ